jgi:hypothetical protein
VHSWLTALFFLRVNSAGQEQKASATNTRMNIPYRAIAGLATLKLTFVHSWLTALIFLRVNSAGQEQKAFATNTRDVLKFLGSLKIKMGILQLLTGHVVRISSGIK